MSRAQWSRLRRALPVVMTLLGLRPGLAAPAAPPPWTAFGPGGGSVLSLAVDPGNPGLVYAVAGFLYAGPSGTLYRSTDGGATWTALGGTGPPGRGGRSGASLDDLHRRLQGAAQPGRRRYVDRRHPSAGDGAPLHQFAGCGAKRRGLRGGWRDAAAQRRRRRDLVGRALRAGGIRAVDGPGEPVRCE